MSVRVRRHLRRTRVRLGVVRPHWRRGSLNYDGIVPQWVGQLRRRIDAGEISVLSASKSDLSDEENDRRTGELVGALTGAGYSFLPGRGVYTHMEGPEKGLAVSERIVLVPHLPREMALRYGRRFGQESVLVGHDLLASDGRLLTKFRPGETVYGSAARALPYHTVVTPQDGGTFAFALVE